MKIGFIGLGIMGTPMALHLVAAGHALFVHTRGRLPEGVAASTATPCANAAEVTQHAEVIFTMLPDTPDVAEVLFGPNGIAAALQADGGGVRKTMVDMSSISPTATKAFAQRIQMLGADHIDALVSGGEVGAKAASLTIMCGGEPAVFEKVRPLLETMGKNITLVGGNGDGVGGITPILKVAALAEHAGLMLAPHFAMELHIHLAAVYPREPWVVHSESLEPLYDERIQIKNGRMQVPTWSGLGLTLIEQAWAWTRQACEAGVRR